MSGKPRGKLGVNLSRDFVARVVLFILSLKRYSEGAVCGFLLLMPLHQSVEPSVDTLAKAAPLFGVVLKPRALVPTENRTWAYRFRVLHKINEPNVTSF